MQPVSYTHLDVYKRQGQDDAALARQFHQLVADSAAYMVGVRVGIGTGAVTSDALESITRFNSSGLAALAGTYASRLAASVLRDVERAARENDRLAFPARGVQNEGREEFSHAAEAAKEVQDNDIYNTEPVSYTHLDVYKRQDTGKVTLPAKEIEQFFPKSYTPEQKKKVIVKLLASWARQRGEQER